MLSNNLNTNEVKNAAGTEVEFEHLEFPPGRARVFSMIGENPSLPHRLSISHEETGTGNKRRRRSRIRFDKTKLSEVDSVTPITGSVYVVSDAPVGHLTTTALIKDLVAELNSFLSTTGAGTTVLFDGTGSGANVLIQGSL